MYVDIDIDTDIEIFFSVGLLLTVSMLREDTKGCTCVHTHARAHTHRHTHLLKLQVQTCTWRQIVAHGFLHGMSCVTLDISATAGVFGSSIEMGAFSFLEATSSGLRRTLKSQTDSNQTWAMIYNPGVYWWSILMNTSKWHNVIIVAIRLLLMPHAWLL